MALTECLERNNSEVELKNLLCIPIQLVRLYLHSMLEDSETRATRGWNGASLISASRH